MHAILADYVKHKYAVPGTVGQRPAPARVFGGRLQHAELARVTLQQPQAQLERILAAGSSQPSGAPAWPSRSR